MCSIRILPAEEAAALAAPPPPPPPAQTVDCRSEFVLATCVVRVSFDSQENDDQGNKRVKYWELGRSRP